jgi:hypothetical protein
MNKTTIVTTLIAALGTVLVAFIGIVPQLRKGDQDKIDQLSSQIAELQKKPAVDLYNLTGRVSRNNMPVTDGLLIAATATDAVSPDDSGKFLFPHMPRQAYWIVVTTQSGPTRRLLINPDDSQPDTAGQEIAISYNFAKE